jgi:ribonuclease P protein component
VARKPRGPLSLPRSERLRGKAQIQALFEQGKRQDQGSVAALWAGQAGPTRVGFAVSRRLGGSVRRNRARRRLREAYRRLRGGLPVGVEVVFIGRSGVAEIPFDRLLTEMGRLIEGIARAAGRRLGAGA